MLQPLAEVRRRVDAARDDSDTAFFHALLYLGELALKLTVGGLVACVDDGRDRYRYRLEHQLVRANGLGTWIDVAEEILVGATSQELAQEARNSVVALARKHGSGVSFITPIVLLNEVIEGVVGPREGLPAKMALSRWMHDFAFLRNKTRAHGAPGTGATARAAIALEQSIQLFIESNPVLSMEWAYLRQNLSGKYRVRPLSEAAPAFESLKSKAATTLLEGVYVHLGAPRRVAIAESDSDLRDFFVWNGGFSKAEFELISYATGDRIRGDGTRYLAPTILLPGSSTDGSRDLQAREASFSNLPTNSGEYVVRSELESDLLGALQRERHEIVTLHGRGGAGKTSLAIQVLHGVAQTGRFDLILWFSARDIDLLLDGPKQVRPQVLTLEDIAAEYASMIDREGARLPRAEQVQRLASELTKSSVGATLFVFDNFETVRNPEELYAWLDTHVRAPNKILITTRHRNFRGDLPIEVAGMTRAQADNLIGIWARKLEVTALTPDEYRARIYEESSGHPYIMKMLLGTIARERRQVDVRRTVAGHENVLTALFERTFAALSPGARRVFLTLCSWSSLVAVLEVKAVLQRPSNEFIDVDEAIGELERFALLEQLTSAADEQVFLRVPLAAALFGRGKLKVDSMKPQVEGDKELLMWFGSAQDADVKRGIAPRIERLLRRVASEASDEPRSLDAYGPLLRFIANGAPETWLEIADLYAEVAGSDAAAEEALYAFLEKAPSAGWQRRVRAWWQLARLAEDREDIKLQAHALSELATEEGVPLHEVSRAASELNRCMAASRGRVDDETKRTIIGRTAAALAARRAEADGTDLSRLAWLYLYMQDESSARDVVAAGLAKDAQNAHLQKLADKLGVRGRYG